MFACRMFLRAIELSARSRHDPTSAFAWHVLELNLPGSPNYDPGKPRFMRIQQDGNLACVWIVFVDDLRLLGPTEEVAVQGVRQLSSGIHWRGCQDAS